MQYTAHGRKDALTKGAHLYAKLKLSFWENFRYEFEYNVKISTIEHLMAAFYFTGIDNVIVEINSQEIPIMDGSAKEKDKVKSIVIGGGFGGIAIALRLRALGHQVTLLEKLNLLIKEFSDENIEIVIVDNGSTDNSNNIIRSHKLFLDKRISLLNIKKNIFT